MKVISPAYRQSIITKVAQSPEAYWHGSFRGYTASIKIEPATKDQTFNLTQRCKWTVQLGSAKCQGRVATSYDAVDAIARAIIIYESGKVPIDD